MTPQEDLARADVAALVANAQRLGLTWSLRPATVSVDSDSAQVMATYDGDTVAITMTSLLGAALFADDRVMGLLVPPAGNFIIGRFDIPAFYRYSTTEYFTAGGTFTKSSYQGLTAVRVRLVSGGGGGGGSAITAGSQSSAGGGGEGGHYAESFLLASALSGSETVSVGPGGLGITGSTGNTGGSSSFGSLVSSTGGGGGVVAGASGNASGLNGARTTPTQVGQLKIQGSGGASGARLGIIGAIGGAGGSSQLGGGANGVGTSTVVVNGAAGRNYGGGGSGACAGPSQAAGTGGAGADGIVIVDIYA